MDDLTMFGYEAKDFLSYLAIGMVGLICWIFRDTLRSTKDKEAQIKKQLDQHAEHFRKVDEALHQIQLQMVRQESAKVDMGKLQNEIEKLDSRMDRLDHHLTRILERLGGNRRAADPDPETL